VLSECNSLVARREYNRGDHLMESRVKRLLLATTAVALAGQAAFSGQAQAAPPLPGAAPFSWTSCYLGGHVGGGWGHAKIVDPNSSFGGLFAPTGSSVGIDQGPGLLGGPQLGCDYQFATNWVVGAAGDFSFADINGQADDPYFVGKDGGPITLRERTQWLSTVTGRLGYVFDRWMLYGKGGAAWAHNRYVITNLPDWGTPANFCAAGGGIIGCTPSGAHTSTGWTAGFGLAFAFSDAWSAGIEYDHYGFGSHTTLLADPNVVIESPLAPIAASQRIDTVEFTLDYHFGAVPRR
jgi:outer membrane immunogenic protein